MEYLNNKLRFKTEVFDGASFLESNMHDRELIIKIPVLPRFQLPFVMFSIQNVSVRSKF